MARRIEFVCAGRAVVLDGWRAWLFLGAGWTALLALLLALVLGLAA